MSLEDVEKLKKQLMKLEMEWERRSVANEKEIEAAKQEVIAEQNKVNELHKKFIEVQSEAATAPKIELDELKQLHKDVDSLKKKLEKKYGSVNINLEDGAITPIEEPKVEKADV